MSDKDNPTEFIEHNLGFQLSDSQKQLIDRIRRGETIHYNQRRTFGKSRFFAEIAKAFGWKTTSTIPANGLHASLVIVDEYTPDETKTEVENEKATNGNC